MGIHQSFKFQLSTRSNLIHRRHQSGWQGIAKSVMDRGLAIAGLAILSPLLAATAIAIKLDSKGPVLFRQSRHGYNNEEFGIWKFRTMTVLENGEAFKQACRNDKRITRLGAFLRKMSIDELPQLFNVLMGEMSLVGPRPHPTALNHQFAPRIAGYWSRHLVKPGLTGLAQVRGFRGPTDTDDKMRNRVEQDLEYIEDWSLWLDIKILLLTPISLLIGKNAF